MYKIVINSCFGGFGVSEQGAKWLLANGASPEKVTINDYGWVYVTCDLERHHPLLVQMVEALGDKASGPHASLRIHTMAQPLYRVNEYDGAESVEEPHHIVWDDASKVTIEADE